MQSRRRWLAAWLLLLVVGSAACERKPSAASQTLPARRAPDTPSSPHRDDASTPAAPAPKVVFLGDSITAGFDLPAEQAFPAVLARLLARDGVRVQVANAGVSGDTSAGGLRRVDWILKQKPAIVVVELGGNDGLRGLPLAALEQNLRDIIARVRAQGASVLLLGMRIPPSYGAEYTSGFEALYERVAQDTGVPFVPFFMEGVAGVPTLNLPDGLHPTAEGHEKLAARLRAKLVTMIGEAAAKSSSETGK